MPARYFYEDDCRDYQRFTAEWVASAPANWSVVYSNNNFWYNTVGGAPENVTLMSMPDVYNVEFFCNIMGIPAPDLNIGVILRNQRGTALTDGAVLLWTPAGLLRFFLRVSGAWVLLTTSAALPAYIGNVPYSLRFRAEGKLLKAKIWLTGTSEPDWQLNYWMTGTRSNLERPGTVALYGEGVITKKWGDIRITPIPRTGGP